MLLVQYKKEKKNNPILDSEEEESLSGKLISAAFGTDLKFRTWGLHLETDEITM